MATENDRAILNCIFNPLLPIGEFVPEEDSPQLLEDEEENTDELQRAKALEVKGVEAAEKGDLNRAIEFFCEAIETAPHRASGYNNRGQAFRLLLKDNEALEDLNKALEQSEGRGERKSRCSALCQRGLLYRKWADNQRAKSDFEEAARLGSSFAKQQLVEINPYAAMCNQMLNQVMSKLYSPTENGA